MEFLGLPKDLPAATVPGLAFGALKASDGFNFVSILEPDEAGVPVDPPLPVVFREVRPLWVVLIVEPTEPLVVGCLVATEERDVGEFNRVLSEIRDSSVPEGFLTVIERPMRDDVRESRGMLELVPLRLKPSPRRADGCLVVVDVDGFLEVICLPICERVVVAFDEPGFRVC